MKVIFEVTTRTGIWNVDRIFAMCRTSGNVSAKVADISAEAIVPSLSFPMSIGNTNTKKCSIARLKYPKARNASRKIVNIRLKKFQGLLLLQNLFPLQQKNKSLNMNKQEMTVLAALVADQVVKKLNGVRNLSQSEYVE